MPPLQAISFLRQKKVGEATKNLNNLVSCEAAVPSDAPVTWGEKEELQDLFSAYCSKVGSVLGAGGWMQCMLPACCLLPGWAPAWICPGL